MGERARGRRGGGAGEARRGRSEGRGSGNRATGESTHFVHGGAERDSTSSICSVVYSGFIPTHISVATRDLANVVVI